MKKVFLYSAFSLFALVNSYGQDIPQGKVPKLIVQEFHSAYPKAYDVEWEKDGELYKVEFELGLLEVEHDIWFDKDAKVVRHKEEVSKTSLPKVTLAYLSENFSTYHIDEVEKITEDEMVVYVVKLKSSNGKLKLGFDNVGNPLNF